MAYSTSLLCALFLVVGLLGSAIAEDPYIFFTWNVTYGTISPLGRPQRVILINGEFPGPVISSVTNNNVVVNVFNNLDEPLLFTWAGVQQRKNSWADGVPGTNCPVLPGTNFTYKFQVKDQIGSFMYYPSTGLQKVAGGFGGLHILSRDRIPVPFDPPADDTTILIGDWYVVDHSKLKKRLDKGNSCWNPVGVLINGAGPGKYTTTVEQGKTYRFRISNVGFASSLNFRIQGHKLRLVEVEGTHTDQYDYDSLDVHLGQSYSVLVTANQAPKDYYIVVSTRFTNYTLNSTGILHYANAQGGPDGQLPDAPPEGTDWSMNQARSIRTNLTASAARPNPQGSFHYGKINITRTIVFENAKVDYRTKIRYAVNGLSFQLGDTPLKLADYYNISGVFTSGSMPDQPPSSQEIRLEPSVLDAVYENFVEIVFQNTENTMQSWHLDGFSFFVAGFGAGKWSPDSRQTYNLFDAVSRSTTQVYPNSWTAILLSLDNAGMWNLRSENWERYYLGQQLYVRVRSPVRSTRDEYEIPKNALMCGKAKDIQPVPPPL